jgi:ABC-type amino acid transport system permease subunit
MRLSRFKLVSWIARIYVSFFRGTPLLVQLFVIYTACRNGHGTGPDAGGHDRLLAEHGRLRLKSCVPPSAPSSVASGKPPPVSA